MKWWTLLQVYKLKARLAYIQHSTKSTLSTEQRYQGKYGILIWWWSGFSFLNLQWQIISTNKSEIIRCNVSWRKLSDLSHSFVPFFFPITAWMNQISELWSLLGSKLWRDISEVVPALSGLVFSEQVSKCICLFGPVHCFLHAQPPRSPVCWQVHSSTCCPKHLSLSICVGMATFLLFTRFSLLSHQNRSFSSYSWKPWYSEWHLRKLQMGSHDVIPSISAEMVVLFHRFYHLCETTL